jgi:hypothetical protein
MTDPSTYQALAIRAGLKLYAKTGMKPNSAWTPGNMLRTAGRITGKTYSQRQYEQAAADLLEWVAQRTVERALDIQLRQGD